MTPDTEGPRTSEPDKASLTSYFSLAALIVGMGASAIWVALIGYGLFALIETLI